MVLPLRTDRLLLEKFEERHVNSPEYLRWLSDRDNLVSLNLVDYLIRPVTRERLVAYYEHFSRSPTDRLFAVSLNSSKTFIATATLREIGYGGLFDLGILVGDKAQRGKGIAREIIECLVKYAFGELAARKICSSFADDNYAVLMAFLKNGFKVEGLQRQQMLTIDGRLVNRYIVGILPDDIS